MSRYSFWRSYSSNPRTDRPHSRSTSQATGLFGLHRLRGLFGLHLLPQGFAVVRWTVENTWLRWSQRLTRLGERGEDLEPRRGGDVRYSWGVALAVRDNRHRRGLQEHDVSAGRDRAPVEAHVVVDARGAELHAVQSSRPRDANPGVVRQRQSGGLALVRRRCRAGLSPVSSEILRQTSPPDNYSIDS